MNKKTTFPEPECMNCPSYHIEGKYSPGETRYCKGFKRRKPKRFVRSDPKYKVPKWCPKRLPVPVCRIHGFVNEQAQFTELMWLMRYETGEGRLVSPTPSHYVVRKEIQLGLTAKSFYNATQETYLDAILPDHVDRGEIVEIDDGLKPYYFYVLDSYTIEPLPYFQFRD